MGDEVTILPENSFDASSQVSEGKAWKRFLSIRMMVIMICLWSVACAAASTAVMVSTSYDSALSDVKSSADITTNTCFSHAESSLTGIVRDLLSLNAATLSDSVLEMLDVAHTATDIVTDSYLHSTPGANLSSWDHLYSQRKEAWRVTHALNDKGLAVVSLSVANTQTELFDQQTFALYANLDLGLTFTLLYTEGKDVFGISVPHDGAISTPFSSDYSLRDEVVRASTLIRYGMIKPSQRRWQRILYQFAYAGIILTSYHHDAVNNREIIFEMSLSLPRMSQILHDFAEKTIRDVGALVYYYTVDASSPFNKQAIESGIAADFPQVNFNQVDFLLGVSNGSSYIAGSEVSMQEGKLLKDVEATDPAIRELAVGIHEKYSYEIIHNSNDTAIVSAVGKEFIIQVTSIQPEGLDWWLVSAIELEYVLGETRRQQEQAKDTVKKENDDIDSRLSKSRTVVLVVVLSIAVFLLLLSTIIVSKMLQPLDNLKHEMRKVSEMNLETETVKTVFYEVNSMQTSFEKMVRNLKEYKAYVPTAVLEGTQAVEVPPPTGNVAVVFTDIVSSTALWARAPCAMNDALEMHNTCIRSALSKYNGYEVKTIGDAFMISFSNKIDAITFCLKTQEEFVKQKWPSDLELTPQYHRPSDSLPMWNGLRLRMGCHIGEATVEENPLTGRVDYRGSIVNMAARLESKALPGTLCINKEVHHMIKGQLSEAGNPVIQDCGWHELKGIGKVDIVVLCPASLAPRLKARQFAYETLSAPTVGLEAELRTTSGNSSLVSTAISDDGSVKVPMHHISKNKKTGLALSSGLLSIAVCRLCDVQSTKSFENYNLMLRAAIEAASQTDGVLGGVTGRTLTVVWNASKSCKLHTTSALRFASQIQWRAGSIARVGISTGTLLHGNVGTNTQRFATAFGRPLEAAEAAADMALRLGTFAVIADCTNDCKLISNSAISPFLRMADLWLDSETNKEIAIYEVLCSALLKQLEDGWGIVTDGSATGADVHNKAFREALCGNEDQLNYIKRQALMCGDDGVLAVCLFYNSFTILLP